MLSLLLPAASRCVSMLCESTASGGGGGSGVAALATAPPPPVLLLLLLLLLLCGVVTAATARKAFSAMARRPRVYKLKYNGNI